MTQKNVTAGFGGERGSVALELPVGFLIWALALLVLASAYQLQSGSDDVADAAEQAARAASLTASPTDATSIARTTARARLGTGACQPGTVTVTVDVSDYRAGGTVAVTVSCRTHPLIGGSRTVRSTSDDVIDRYRGGL